MLRNISCYREINNAQKLFWWCQIGISCDVIGIPSARPVTTFVKVLS